MPRDPHSRCARDRHWPTHADREAAVADELAARSSLAALFGVSAPVETVIGKTTDFPSQQVVPSTSLEVRLADADRVAAQASVREQLAERRLDPAVGVGLRHIRETGDVAGRGLFR